MMETMMEISPLNGGSFTLDAGFRDGLADYARRRWPTHTAKNIEREWDLTTDEAKNLLKGQTSLRTIEKVLAHKNGGWHVALPILGGVIGHGLTDFITSEKSRLNHEAEQRRRKAAMLEEAESFLHAADVGAVAPRRGSDLDPCARAGMALCAS